MLIPILPFLLLSSQVHGGASLRTKLTERDANFTGSSNITLLPPGRQLLGDADADFSTTFNEALRFNGAGFTVTNEFINNTATGTYSLIILYGVAVINITVQSCLLQPTARPFGQWVTLDNQTEDSASMSDIIGDAYSFRNQYGDSYGAMLQSTTNNCQDTLEIIDEMFEEIVCSNSTPIVQQSGLLGSITQAISNLPIHNELRHLLATEAAPETVMRQNLKYFGFLIAASAVSGIVVGTATNKIYPNNTSTQTFSAGLFPAAVVLLSGILNWIATRQLRNDVRVLVAAAAAAKLKDNAVKVVKVVKTQATSAIKKRKIGKTPSGTNIIQLGGTAMGGGSFCAESNSFADSYPYVGQLSDPSLALESLNEATQAVLESMEEGTCGPSGIGPSGVGPSKGIGPSGSKL